MKARVSDHGLDERKNWMPSIPKENEVVTLVNVFTVEPANQQKVVDMLVKATETTMKKIPGFVSASIHKSLDGVRVVNYAQWRSAQDFEAMRNNPAAQKHMKPLMEISKPDFHLYEVIDAFEGKR
jgi:quinol monooxygenase YgiN